MFPLIIELLQHHHVVDNDFPSATQKPTNPPYACRARILTNTGAVAGCALFYESKLSVIGIGYAPQLVQIFIEPSSWLSAREGFSWDRSLEVDTVAVEEERLGDVLKCSRWWDCGIDKGVVHGQGQWSGGGR